MHEGNNVTVLSNRDLSNGPYRLLVFDEGVLVGANLINGFERAGKLRKAMIRKLNWEQHFGPLNHLPSDQEIEQFLADVPESSNVPFPIF